MGPIKDALTFDDVTLAPKYSSVLPSDVQTETSLTSNLQLKIPLITSAMDTVTESQMAINMALQGAIGIIHYNQTVEEQAAEEAPSEEPVEEAPVEEPVEEAPMEESVEA